MNKAVDTAVTTAVCSLQALYSGKSQSRDSNAAISLVKCKYVCLRFETLARKAEFAKRKKSSMFLFRKFSARNLQTNYLFKTVSKRYFSHRFVLGLKN